MELNELSKDQLIEITRALHGSVGDTGRNNKEYYVTLLNTKYREPALKMAEEMQAQRATTAAQQPPVHKLLEALSELSRGVSREEVTAMIEERLTAATRTIVLGPTTQRAVEGATHELFEDVLALANLRQPILLYGNAGNGKKTIAHQVAQALGLSVCTAPASGGCIILPDITNLTTDEVNALRACKDCVIIATTNCKCDMLQSTLHFFAGAMIHVHRDHALEQQIVDPEVLAWANNHHHKDRMTTQFLVRLTAQKANLEWGEEKWNRALNAL